MTSKNPKHSHSSKTKPPRNAMQRILMRLNIDLYEKQNSRRSKDPGNHTRGAKEKANKGRGAKQNGDKSTKHKQSLE